MKKGIFVRIFVGLAGGIAISYLITIIISAAIGDGVYYPCVPSLVERYQNELAAVIVQTILSAVLGAGFSAASLIWEKDEWSLGFPCFITVLTAVPCGRVILSAFFSCIRMSAISFCAFGESLGSA